MTTQTWDGYSPEQIEAEAAWDEAMRLAAEKAGEPWPQPEGGDATSGR